MFWNVGQNDEVMNFKDYCILAWKKVHSDSSFWTSRKHIARGGAGVSLVMTDNALVSTIKMKLLSDSTSRMRRLLSINCLLLICLATAQAKRGSIYDQVDAKPTFFNEFDDFDDFGTFDLDPVDVEKALELNGLDASPDDILQAMMDYQELVDSIDDEMTKEIESLKKIGTGVPYSYSIPSIKTRMNQAKKFVGASGNLADTFSVMPNRNGKKKTGSRKKDTSRRGRKNQFLGSFKRSFVA